MLWWIAPSERSWNDEKDIQNGDYLIPDLKLSQQPEKPLGKYGRMRKWEMRPNALLLCLFGMNCNIFLMFTFRFIGKCHFECSIVQ